MPSTHRLKLYKLLRDRRETLLDLPHTRISAISAISAICITNWYFFSKRVIDEYEDNDRLASGGAA